MSMTKQEEAALAAAGAQLSKALVKSVLERWFIWFGDSPASHAELQGYVQAAAVRWPGGGLMAREAADDLAPEKGPVDESFDAVRDATVYEEPPAVADDLDDMLG